MQTTFIRLCYCLWIAVIIDSNPQAVLTLERAEITLDSVDIVIRGENLSAVGAITLRINYSSPSLQWGRLINEQSGLSGSIAGVNNDLLTIAWDDLSGFSVSNAILYRLRFRYAGGPFNMNFNTMLSELADVNGNVLSVIYNNLSVTSVQPHNVETMSGTLHIYPNPAKGSFMLSFFAPGEGRGTIELIDVRGETVQIIPLEYIGAGSQQFSFVDLPGEIPTGMYILRVRFKNILLQKKILLIK